ncbi:unnamed protein product [Closterium sp. Yama58-4]|nr:unnamed protein product [Closterium sp. Yama58-4]
MHPGTMHPGTMHPGTMHPGTMHPGTMHPGTMHPGTMHPGTMHPGTMHPGTMHPGTMHPGTMHPGTMHPGTMHPGTMHPGTMHPGTMHPGTMHPGTMHPGTMHPGTMHPGTMHPGTMHPGTMQPGTMHPGTMQPVTTLPVPSIPVPTLSVPTLPVPILPVPTPRPRPFYPRAYSPRPFYPRAYSPRPYSPRAYSPCPYSPRPYSPSPPPIPILPVPTLPVPIRFSPSLLSPSLFSLSLLSPSLLSPSFSPRAYSPRPYSPRPYHPRPYSPRPYSSSPYSPVPTLPVPTLPVPILFSPSLYSPSLLSPYLLSSCILPSSLGVGAAGEVQLRGTGGGGFEQARQGREGEAVKVTLHDCLACSGCVTTAETVMLEQQSAHHMLQHLPHPRTHADSAGQTGHGEQGRKVVVVSLSPQSRAALAAHYKITPLQAFRKLTSFLHSLGVAAVFDTSASRDVALIEACHEFVCAFRRRSAAHATTTDTSASAGSMNGSVSGHAAMPHASFDDHAAAGATPSAPSDMVPAAGSAAATEAAEAGGRESSAEAAQECGQSAPPNATPPPIPTDSLPHLPVLASACPGWVCYAEKAHGDYILPHMSRVKSAQQTMGALLKRFYASRLNTTPEQLYHVAVMPCYDKKLEAARDDFLLPQGAQGGAQDGGENSRDAEGDGERLTEVDCVLTSGEIFALLQEQGVDFMALEEHPLDSITRAVRRARAPGALEWQAVRNADMRECSVAVGGQPVLRVACAYGFRNIQNVLRRAKQGRCPYHYVEVMACPGGCLNGGGQRPPEQRKAQPTRSYLQDLEAHYMAQVETRSPFANPLAQQIYSQFLGSPLSPSAQAVLHTSFHARPKTLALSAPTLAASW